MSPKQKRRLMATCLILAGVGIATALAVTALTDNISYLYSPSTVVENELEPGTRFRLGGVVLEDSIQRIEGLKVRFAVTDRVLDHEVRYEGILPDLFREGQSVIAHGHLGDDGIFQADKILAKHDETYMPAEVMAAMEQAQDKTAYGTYGDGSDGGEKASAENVEDDAAAVPENGTRPAADVDAEAETGPDAGIPVDGTSFDPDTTTPSLPAGRT